MTGSAPKARRRPARMGSSGAAGPGVSVTDRNLILRPPVREDGAAGPLEVAAENCARTTSSAEWSVASKWTRRNPTMDVRQERPKADFGKPVSAHSRLSAKRTANTGRRFPSPGCCAATPSPLGRWFFCAPLPVDGGHRDPYCDSRHAHHADQRPATYCPGALTSVGRSAVVSVPREFCIMPSALSVRCPVAPSRALLLLSDRLIDGRPA